MLFSFQCPLCQGTLEADASSSGSQAECPRCGQLVAIPASRLEEGATLAGFRLERRLGKGAMGEVFLARQLSVDREVAVKVLPPGFAENQEAVARFLREGKVAAQLDHANIATVYEAGEDNGNYYLAMAYIEGESFDRRLARDGRVNEKTALQTVRAVADALDYAWQAFGLLHRDIKPANIMVDARHRVFLMDLGLAKCQTEESGMTMSGTVLGTPRYMSPEQALGNPHLGVASDVYSLGATLYHLATGAPPFTADSVPQLLHQHVYEPLPPPRDRNPKLSDGCVQLLESMLAKSAEERHGDWGTLVADIDRVLGGGTPHVGTGGTPHGGRTRKTIASLARQAQKALARQHQSEFEHEHEHEHTKKARLSAWYRRPVVLVPAAAAIVLLLAVLGVVVSRRGGGRPQARRGQVVEAQLPEPPAKEEAAEPVPEEPPPEPAKPSEPSPDASPSPEPAPVPEPVPEPASAPIAPAASRLAMERITLPHTGDWALEFSRHTDCVVVPDLDWGFVTPLTVEAVLKATKSEGAFLAAGRAGNAGVWLGIRDGKLVARRRAEDGTVVSAMADLVEGRAMHAAAVWDGAELRLYLNGYLVARGDAPHAWAMPAREEFLVGAYAGGVRNGSVQAVRVSAAACYTGDFDIEQALPLKAAADTLCLLDLEEGQGEEARDSSGHNRHGRIEGARWRRMWPCPVTEERLHELAAALRKANPGVTDLRMLVEPLPNGIMLDLKDNPSLRELSPLAGLPLQGLDASQTSVDDLAPLRGMRLGWLWVNRWSGYSPTGEGVSDLSPLAGMPLVSLGLGHQQLVRDLSSLKGCPLRLLYLGNTQVGDLRPLAGAPLEVLLVHSAALTDLSPLRGMPLRALNIGGCSLVTDLEPLSHCRDLEILQTPANMAPPSAQFCAAFPKMKSLNAGPKDQQALDLGQAIRDQIWDEWVQGSGLVEKARPAAESAAVPSLTILARPILAGQIGELLPVWRANNGRFAGELTAKQRDAITNQLVALAGIDRRVMASFRSDIGKTIPVELPNGKATCQIRGVGPDGVRVMQTVRRGTAVGRVGRVLRPADLGVGEKLRRLGLDETPERNLQRGMLAVTAGRADIACRFFAKAEVPLARALIDEIETSQTKAKESQNRRQAELAGAELLHRLGCSTSVDDHARIVARIRERVDGDLRRIRHARELLADFERKWGDNEGGEPYAQAVRQALLHPWPGDEVLTIQGIGLELVPLAAGEFKMDGHTIRISRPFWMGKYEVTQEEFAAMTGKNPSRNKGSRNPVEMVDWGSSYGFCRSLTSRERKAGRLPKGYEFRLPTEAEWVFACLAGTAGPLAGKPDQMGWHQGNSDGRSHEVGGKSPNAWGLYDLHGNVFEWCLDWSDSTFYSRAPEVDPVNLTTGMRDRVCAGGGWNHGVDTMAANRHWQWGPQARLDCAGFRVCLGPEIPLPVAATTASSTGLQPVEVASKDGWLILFDGSAMAGWTPAGTWTAKDGLLLAPGREQSVLWTRAAYGDYELDLEFRLEARANSGVYLNDATAGMENHAQYGIEVQLIDDAAYDDLAPEQRCGSIFKRTARRKDAAKPAGEWNRVRIRCRRQRVVVTMNGQKIVDSDVLTKAEIQALQGSSAVKDLKLARGDLPPGRIGLQSHTGVVQFRSIRLREL